MARSIYIASPEGQTGKSTIALGLVDLFVRRVERVGIFRPVVPAGDERDNVLELLLSHDGVDLSYEDAVGVTYDEVHADEKAAMSRIVQRFHAVEERSDVVVIVGSDYTDVAGPAELAFNGRVAANLGAPVLLAVRAMDRSTEEIAQVVDIATSELRSDHATVAAVAINRCEPDRLEEVRAAVARPDVPVWVFPEIPVLAAPTISDLVTALEGTVIAGDDALLAREAESILVCGMNVEHILERLTEGQVAIAAGDRSEVLIALAAAHSSQNFPSLAGIVLNGGFEPNGAVRTLVEGLGRSLPIITTQHNTYESARIASTTRGVISRGSQRKRDLALGAFERSVDVEDVVKILDVPRSDVVTPLMFEARLLDRARAARKHIVLPEGNDDRILRAASTLLSRGVAELTLLGVESAVRDRASDLGLDIDAATVVDPRTSDLLQPFAEEYTRLRAHRGMTLERALEIMPSVSYFGTMMVHTGRADGMVSGALHTTAHTIKPSFEIIKTRPGTSIVSSVFLMALADRVLVYGDCAVNPDPNAEQLADIAISSAETSAQFGIEPRIAMLSYSTGTSGSGADVDKVRAATEIVRERRPDLSVEGPIQYDAAVDASVAQTKLPGSQVAGKATVFIFPDLNTGNNTYKAVQRSAGAVAIGPVLQGLNKPVNDLSRGALVQDIVNTVAITAIQAQANEEQQ
ncbi:phosphate acetyltransferase [Georgenia sp. 311]|uniref:Phosphate acetyltransferase n=1 Tax=Georgenia wutianyii TaxID=2585135 RepID=A0ABX5VT56_9MICO|nr:MULTISPECIES: phosphate acetyltransferase [Georgenia]QDB80165.1 phosphate acetyltransferase [Georgenia wutianyii]TNC20151.1 phosphate acetyltransferase [Georgenia sp. 311]